MKHGEGNYYEVGIVGKPIGTPVCAARTGLNRGHSPLGGGLVAGELAARLRAGLGNVQWLRSAPAIRKASSSAAPSCSSLLSVKTRWQPSNSSPSSLRMWRVRIAEN